MDLAASAAFVAESAESDLLKQPPRDPQASFMDRPMVGSIFIAAIGLAASVSVAYLVTWFGGAAQATAQTVAFFTWLLGHIVLALGLRSELASVFHGGIFSNRFMNLWVAATVAFVMVVGAIPAIQTLLRAAPLSPSLWLLVLAAAIAGGLWMEAVKWVRRRLAK